MFEDNTDQQIGLSFIDEVAAYDAWELICYYKGIENERIMHLPSEENLDQIIDDLTGHDQHKQTIQDIYRHYYSDDVT